MKILRVSLFILALAAPTFAVSKAPSCEESKQRGGSLAPGQGLFSLQAEGCWGDFICYSNPSLVHECCNTPDYCHGLCVGTCGGPCSGYDEFPTEN